MNKTKVFIYHGKDNYPILRYQKLVQQKLIDSGKHYDHIHIELYDKVEQNKVDGLSFTEKWEEIELLFSSPSFGVDGVCLYVWNYEKILTKATLPIVKRIIKNIDHNFLFLASANLQSTKKIINQNIVKEFDYVNYKWVYYTDKKTIENRLLNFAEDHHLKFSSECLSYLVKHFIRKTEMVDEARTDLMKTDLDKVALYFKKNSVITSEKLVGIIDEIREENKYYDIINAFFLKDIPLTLKNFLIFIREGGEFNLLLRNFISEIMSLIEYKEKHLVKQSSPGDQFSQNSYLSYFEKKKLEDNQKRNARFPKLSEVLDILNDFILLDRQLKTYSLKNSNVVKPKIELNIKLSFEKLVLLRLADHSDLDFRKKNNQIKEVSASQLV